MQGEDPEGMLEHQLARLRAIALSPRVLFAERDVVQG